MPATGVLLAAKVLVVDDLERDARLVEAMLRGAGHTDVTVLTDPTAAAPLHAARRFDVVILDVLMPGMDGFEVLERLRAIDRENPVPVIVVTAEPEHIARALEQGARDFIGKPLRMVELVSRTRNAIELGMLMRDTGLKYRTLVEQSIAGIYVVDDGRWTYLNPRLCEMLGYSVEELIGTPSLDLVVGEDHDRLLDNRRRAFAGDRTALKGLFRMRRKDGAVVTICFEARLIEARGRTVIFGVATDETERERAQGELRGAYERLRTLSDHVLAIQEEERRRISRELHDDLGQSLVALEIAMHRLEPGVQSADRALLSQCMSVAAGVREKLHEMSLELHPPHLDQLGLPDALRWLCGRQRELTATDIDCRIVGADGLRMPPQIEAACYRICQEALNNAARHACARRVSVELTARNGRVTIRVSDDGVGFDRHAHSSELMLSGHMGLISMEERARLAGGHFELRSAPEEGTSVSASFSLPQHASESVPARERA